MQAQPSMAEHFTLNYTTIHCVVLDTKFTYYVKMLVAARIVSKTFVRGQFFSLFPLLPDPNAQLCWRRSGENASRARAT